MTKYIIGNLTLTLYMRIQRIILFILNPFTGKLVLIGLKYNNLLFPMIRFDIIKHSFYVMNTYF